MSTAALTAGFVAIWVLAWLVLGVLRAVRDLLAERAASWLLPPDQPVTFRAGQFVAFLAAGLAPKRFPELHLQPGVAPHFWYFLFPVYWRARYWPEPEALLAELDEDLREARRVLDPLRLAAPLLIEATWRRLSWLGWLAFCLAWTPLGILLYLFIAPAIVREEARSRIRKARYRWGRLSARRRSDG